MQMYLNDSVKTFEFVLEGELTGDAVRRLEYAWISATSILDGKEVFVDVSGLTAADAEGIELLHRITGSGARLRAAPPPNSEDFLRSLGVVVAPPRRGGRSWRLSPRQLFGIVARALSDCSILAVSLQLKYPRRNQHDKGYDADEPASTAITVDGKLSGDFVDPVRNLLYPSDLKNENRSGFIYAT